MSMETPATPESLVAPRWKPLEAFHRRVLGVLVEKAKTTPENYPITINALRAGCNQKSNRSPLMQLEESQVDESLEELRKLGAVSQVQGSGRVDRYRHLAYEWLGVEKVELAVMAELLLRGAQTVGELRGRAARMEPIKDLGELQPTLDSLQAKGLVQYLTPPGRGAIVTHSLYLEREMEKVRREAGMMHPTAATAPAVGRDQTKASAESEPSDADSSLTDEIASLRDELATLRQELEAARSEFTMVTDELRRDLDQLNQQLGN